MNQDKIMKGLRALMEAVTDSDGRSDQAQEIVDTASRKLSKLYDFDFKEGGNVFGDIVPETIERLLPVELLLVDDRETWEHKLCYVPKHIVEQESQDAFIRWLWSDDGKVFNDDLVDSHVIAVFISSWPEGVGDHPRLDDGDILFGRGQGGYWTLWRREDSGFDEIARAAFQAWDEGQRRVEVIDDDETYYDLYTVPEAEYHHNKLMALPEEHDAAVDAECSMLESALSRKDAHEEGDDDAEDEDGTDEE